MSMIEQEKESIEQSIRQIPEIVISDRVDIARKSGMITELLNGQNSLSGLKDGYYKLIQKYATERAYYIENTDNRLDFYNINDASVWSQAWNTGFTFPTTSEFIVYCFLDNGDRVDISNGYNLISNEGDLVEYYQAITIQPDQQNQPDYIIETVTVSGVNHEKLIFQNPITLPKIGDEFALINSDGRLVGIARVGIEGLGLSDWNATDPSVDPYNQTDIDNWYSSITELPSSDFISLGGEFLNVSVPIDDVLRSADPANQADTSKPYTQAKLENNPFYPALNTDESSWPEDFNAPDVKNRKLVVDGNDEWAVYPQFRWEGKLIPDLTEDPNSENLPTTYYIEESIQFFNDMLVSVDDFPVNSGSLDDTMEYYWDETTDLIYLIETISGTAEPPVVVDCTYNSITYKLENWDSEIQPLFDTVKSLINSDVNTIDQTQLDIDDDHYAYIEQLETLLSDVRTHHDSWFDSLEDGDITKFDGDFGEYDLTNQQALDNELSNNSITIFTDRITNIESVIGSAASRTGYVGQVINAVDTIVNRNFGFLTTLKKAEQNIDTSKEILTQLRKKYDVYNSGV